MKGQGMAKTKEKRKKRESPVRYIKADDKEKEDRIKMIKDKMEALRKKE